jgi:hypothetical protein
VVTTPIPPAYTSANAKTCRTSLRTKPKLVRHELELVSYSLLKQVQLFCDNTVDKLIVKQKRVPDGKNN